jgi:hypothetical protein
MPASTACTTTAWYARGADEIHLGRAMVTFGR